MIDRLVRQLLSNSLLTKVRFDVDTPDVPEEAVDRHDHLRIGRPVQLAGRRADNFAVHQGEKGLETKMLTSVLDEGNDPGCGIWFEVFSWSAVTIPKREVVSDERMVIGWACFYDLHLSLLTASGLLARSQLIDAWSKITIRSILPMVSLTKGSLELTRMF
jgi:hypothetical protein